MAITRQWLDRVGGVEVERIGGVRRSGATADLSKPAKGVLHTTEGGWDGSLSVFRNRTGTPTFMVGKDGAGKLRVAQFMPIGEMALTLENDPGGVETNRWARVQIEVIAFSRRTAEPAWFHTLGRKPMSTAEKNLIADLVAEASIAAGIPRKHAGAGLEKRSSSRWIEKAGWFGHSEVPENAHWDPGNFDWDDLFRRGQRWEARIITNDGAVQAKSSQVRPSELRGQTAKFVARRAGLIARLTVKGKRPRVVRARIR